LAGILAEVSGWFLRSLEYCSNLHLSIAYWVHVLMSAISQEIAESWYLDKSEDESEEGLDDNMMAYVHQAKEILIKFVSDLLQAAALPTDGRPNKSSKLHTLMCNFHHYS
jgi:hypothetical protein